MKLPYARLHDSPLDNPGMRLVDIQQIFCNAGADADDPSSYYFRQTDDYIANCRRCGTDIIYRLGTSIEHSNERYYSYPPDDYEKWADICIHIIRHYNEGWNNGFNWNIRYWEIWNEPDLHDNMWNADLEEFIRFYGIVAARIKRRFPKLMIGGPPSAGSTNTSCGSWPPSAAEPARRSTSSAGTAIRPISAGCLNSPASRGACSTNAAFREPNCT